MISTLLTVGPLNAGASVTLPHGLKDPGGKPKAPSTVLPGDSTSPIAVVGTPTATTVTFINNGSAPASATFRVRIEHSIVSAGNDPIFWRGASAGGGGPSESVLVRSCPTTGFSNVGSGWWIISGAENGAGPTFLSSINDGQLLLWTPGMSFNHIRASGTVIVNPPSFFGGSVELHAHIFLSFYVWDATTGLRRVVVDADGWPTALIGGVPYPTIFADVTCPVPISLDVDPNAVPLPAFWKFSWDISALAFGPPNGQGGVIPTQTQLFAAFQVLMYDGTNTQLINGNGPFQPFTKDLAAVLSVGA